MHNRLDILRVPSAPMSSPMYVYYHGTDTQITLYNDRKCTSIAGQPFLLRTTNIHFYCKENVRVDLKIISDVYTAGFILIKDQLMINQDTYLDKVLTLLDGTITADINGNLLVTEL